MLTTTKPPFRVGYRRRSTTTPLPTRTSSKEITSSTPHSRLTKTKPPSRRKVVPSRNPTTAKPVESQASTPSPTRVTNRFKFVSRKPFLRHTTPKSPPSNTSDQVLEPSIQQSLEKHSTLLPEVAVLVPQAKPSRKRPQYTHLNPSHPSRERNISTTTPQRFNGKTVAITVPYTSSQGRAQSTSQTSTADQFAPNRVTGPALVSEVFSSPKPINGQEFLNKYSTRSKSRYPTTEGPLVIITPSQTATTRRRNPVKAFDKVFSAGEPLKVHQPAEYDYYDNVETSIVGKIPAHSKVLLHTNGIIECLDQGNFPHPLSCRKFIYCAKMDNDKIIGWEYTCPKNLSFDPIGGMCNWSAGLGCYES